MTRKRFKRLLMAHGYQSREAEYAALCALSEYGEYRLIPMAERIRECVRPMFEALKDSLKEGIPYE